MWTAARYAMRQALAQQLQREGAQAFVTSWRRLLQRIEEKSAALATR